MTHQPNVHGMDATAMPADWPALTERELVAVLAGFPELAGDVKINWHSPRPFSAAARVQTLAGELFVKRHHQSVRTAAQLAEEHGVIAHLHQQGLPVPAVCQDAQGDTAIVRGQWVYEVQQLAQGEDMFRDTLSWEPVTSCERAETLGCTLANLHQALLSYPATPCSTSLLVAKDDLLQSVDAPQALADLLTLHPALATYLADKPWRSDLANVFAKQADIQPMLARQPRCWTHNDWHVSNLFWQNDHDDAPVSAILDFGLASPTFPLFDLATAIERNAIAWLELPQTTDIGYARTANALLRGYHQIRPLSKGDIALLTGLLPVVQLDYAVSEICYFQGITHSSHNADVAYYDFLIAHSDWFDSLDGKQFLAQVAGV